MSIGSFALNALAASPAASAAVGAFAKQMSVGMKTSTLGITTGSNTLNHQPSQTVEMTATASKGKQSSYAALFLTYDTGVLNSTVPLASLLS